TAEILVPLPFAERAVVVRAAILERVELAVAVVDADRGPADRDDLRGAWAKLGERRDVDLRHYLLERQVVAHALPLLRQRRSLRLVQGDLEDTHAENGALQANRRQWDADLVEQLVLRHRRDLGGRAALDDLREHRRRGLRDRAAAPLEGDVRDDVAVEADVDRNLVAAERVLPFCVCIRGIEYSVRARVLVVIEDQLAIEGVLRHQTSLSPS